MCINFNIAICTRIVKLELCKAPQLGSSSVIDPNGFAVIPSPEFVTKKFRAHLKSKENFHFFYFAKS